MPRSSSKQDDRRRDRRRRRRAPRAADANVEDDVMSVYAKNAGAPSVDADVLLAQADTVSSISTDRYAVTFMACYLASLQRAVRQKRRALLTFIVELLLPILFAFVTVIIWLAFWRAPEPEASMLSYDTASSTIIPNFYNTMMCSNTSMSTDVAGIPGLMPCSSVKYVVNCEGDESTLPVKGLCYNAEYSLASLLGLFLNSITGFTATVLPLDTIIMHQWIARKGLASGEIQNVYMATSTGVVNSRLNAILSSGLLLFVPVSNATTDLMKYLNRTSFYFRYVAGGAFDTVDEAVAAGKASQQSVWCVIELHAFDAENFNVSIHMNSSSLPDLSKTVDIQYFGGRQFDRGELYVASGYNSLQRTLYEYYIGQVAARSMPSMTPEVVQAKLASVHPYLVSFGYVEYTPNVLLNTAAPLVAFALVLSFIYPTLQLVKSIVLEKELRIREAMLIMGQRNSALNLTWFTLYAMQHLLVCLVLTMLLKVTYVRRSNAWCVFTAFYAFALTTIPLAHCIAAFFSKARLAGMLTPLIYFAMSMPIFAITSSSTAVLVGFSLLPPTAFASLLSNILQLETSEGFSFADVTSDKFSPRTSVYFMMLLVEFVVYYIIMLYLDAVLPKEWGTRKHPLFFIRDPLRRLCASSGRRGTTGRYNGAGEDGRYPDGVFEEGSDDDGGDDAAAADGYGNSDDSEVDDDAVRGAGGQQQQRRPRCSVRIVGLRKQYHRNGKSFVAVNNFYWRLRAGEIAVLLGHNGAGKTTLMSMLTGMTSPDAGDCFIYGHSVHEELSRARQLIGFCPQHNILWPELTCREHLEYYAAIKGLRGSVLQQSVQTMLREVDLLDKIDYPSRALSGGQKRKLSIAIAFVGRSPLVFLDEPTAGMDVAARRYTWELLKRMARSHTILLSTHFMDEADLLGDTIAIMSHGRLQCCGTSLFLKARLGVGYKLLLSISPDAEVDVVHNAVYATLPQARMIEYNGSDVVYKLEGQMVSLLPAMLQKLEKMSSNLGVRGFSVSATTLEEVFLQLSMAKNAEHESANGEQAALSRDTGRAVFECAMTTSAASLAWSQFKAMMRKRWLNGLRDRRMQCFQIICPVLCVFLAMIFSLVNARNSAVLSLSAEMFGRPVEVLMENCSSVLGPLVGTNATNMTVYTDPRVASSLNMSWYMVDTFLNHELPRYTAVYCNDANLLNVTGYETSAMLLFYNTSSYHTTALALYQVYSLLLQNLTGNRSRFLGTEASMLVDKSDAVLRGGVQVILISAIVMIPFTFLPSNPVAWVVKERECKARHLQRIAGLMFYVYWLSNYLYDVAAYILTACLMLVIFAIFQRKEYAGPETIGPFVVSMLAYGLCSTAMAYMLSFLFHEHSLAQGSVMAFTFASGFLLVIFVFILSMNDDTKDASRKMRFPFRLVPSFCIGEIIINLATNEQGKSLNTWVPPWSLDVVGWPCIYMAIELPVFMFLTLLYDHPRWRTWLQSRSYKRTASSEIIPDEDSDVNDERNEVYEQEAQHHNEDLVRVVDLRKVYGKNKVAIRNLAFSILPNEVFGFLGTNGAGKTTTMSILCQEFLPTSGCAYVCAYDVAAESSEALRCIGYCPQFDATLDLLTVYDHLQLYAGIRGIAYRERGRVVEGIIQLCGLSNYRNVQAHQLSGGNRRKLSVGIALVGGPPVVFLDEPSAGMDPVARRGLWNTIQTIAKDCSIVLTTHHLEEVEVLANTVAIMANGTLCCIGDKTHLKNKYGSGYDLSLRLADVERRYAVHDFVMQMCSDATLTEFKGNRLVYQLSNDTLLSNVFGTLERSKLQLGVTDYSISQTSIEQVFLRISAESRLAMLNTRHEARFGRSHVGTKLYNGNSIALRKQRSNEDDDDADDNKSASMADKMGTQGPQSASRTMSMRQQQQQQPQMSPQSPQFYGMQQRTSTLQPGMSSGYQAPAMAGNADANEDMYDNDDYVDEAYDNAATFATGVPANVQGNGDNANMYYNGANDDNVYDDGDDDDAGADTAYTRGRNVVFVDDNGDAEGDAVYYM